eukprot:5075449-Alexandrium_andersonii.AAC.1
MELPREVNLDTTQSGKAGRTARPARNDTGLKLSWCASRTFAWHGAETGLVRKANWGRRRRPFTARPREANLGMAQGGNGAGAR